jgi:hypothetical protein
MLPVDAIVDLDNFYRHKPQIRFDAYRQVWVAHMIHHVTDGKYQMFHINRNTLSITENDNKTTIHGEIWRTSTAGNIAFEYMHNEYKKSK